MCTINIHRNDHTHAVFDVSEMIARKVILRSVAASEKKRRLTFEHLYRHS